MATLESRFEDKLREALLDNVAEQARQPGGLADQVQAHAHELLEAYGQRHDYDVQPIIEAGETRVEGRKGRVLVRWGWPEPAIFFERGTVDHAVRAREADVLSFIWEDPPQWVRNEFDAEGDGYRVFLPETNVSGLPESRFIRDTLNWVRRRFA